jgi:hypothetical protein
LKPHLILRVEFFCSGKLVFEMLFDRKENIREINPLEFLARGLHREQNA